MFLINMVKPHEEEQAKMLDERQSKTLLTIFFRYIQDTYKQFKWKVNFHPSEGSIRADLGYQIGELLVIAIIKKEGTVRVMWTVSKGGRPVWTDVNQNFP